MKNCLEKKWPEKKYSCLIEKEYIKKRKVKICHK